MGQRDDLQRLKRLAWLADNSIGIPYTPWRIGFEGLIGLIPGIGDFAGLLLSIYLIWVARRAGVSGGTRLRMAGYVVLDFLVGIVTVVGDAFDFAFKANARIARLALKEVDQVDR